MLIERCLQTALRWVGVDHPVALFMHAEPGVHSERGHQNNDFGTCYECTKADFSAICGMVEGCAVGALFDVYIQGSALEMDILRRTAFCALGGISLSAASYVKSLREAVHLYDDYSFRHVIDGMVSGALIGLTVPSFVDDRQLAVVSALFLTGLGTAIGLSFAAAEITLNKTTSLLQQGI